ncbi:hypothetical protein DFH07DRAFT_960187 [Mycena maculata]|uniref:Uncharacterized protein n=1 Tax=Mycena maculata TaxID=230809 RepID=A0AAD7J0R1_9AGAR|nr:hypothetical protein DFH07DRAFT_960187 [Mycena maculata]
MSERAQAMRYIDKYASNADDSENSDIQDDPDSYEVQVHAADQHNFGAGNISQMHAAQMDPLTQGRQEQRVEALTAVLENLRDQEQRAKEPRTRTPAGSDDEADDIQSSPSSPIPTTPHSADCAPTPAFIPAPPLPQALFSHTENGPSPPRLYCGVHLPHPPCLVPTTPGPLLVNVAIQTHQAEPHALETWRPDSLTWKLPRIGTPKKKTMTKHCRTSPSNY